MKNVGVGRFALWTYARPRTYRNRHRTKVNESETVFISTSARRLHYLRVWLEEELGAENEREFGRANPDGEPSAWVRRLPHLALARAELKQAQAALGLAELQLARTDISLLFVLPALVMVIDGAAE